MFTLEPTAAPVGAPGAARPTPAASVLERLVDRLRAAVARHRAVGPELDLDGDDALVIDLLAPPPVVARRDRRPQPPAARPASRHVRPPADPTPTEEHR